MLNDLISQFKNSIYSDGKLFPQAVFRNSDPDARREEYRQIFTDASMGATSLPTTKSVLTARQLLKQADKPEGLNIDQTGQMMDLVKKHLNIPATIRNRLSDSKILNEIVSLAQKPRDVDYNIPKIELNKAVKTAKQFLQEKSTGKMAGSKATQSPLYDTYFRGEPKGTSARPDSRVGGIYLTKSKDYAKTFAGKEGSVNKYTAKIEKPYDITDQVLNQPERELLIEAPQNFPREIESLRKQGYDAITYKDQVLVLDPKKVQNVAQGGYESTVKSGLNQSPLYDTSKLNDLGKMNVKNIEQSPYANVINKNGKLELYHGSSSKNIEAIRKSGVIKNQAWFAPDEATARRFAQQVGGKPEVIKVEVNPNEVLFNGNYFTAQPEKIKLNELGDIGVGQARSVKSAVISASPNVAQGGLSDLKRRGL